MFEITKSSKGRSYKTNDPTKAMEAYKNKKSLSMYHNETVVRTKCIKNSESSNRLQYQYMEKC